jgi:ribosomal protein L7/L12
MEKLQFAHLISYITQISQVTLALHQVEAISVMINDGAEVKNISPIKFNSILKHISEGRKIEAIKEYRALFNVGLKEAKDAVEGLL